MKKKIIFIVLIVIILVIIGIGVYIIKIHPDTKIVQNENVTFEINTEHLSSELIKSLENGSIVTEEFNLTTDTLGEKEAIIKYIDTWNKEQEIKVSYNIVDTTSPEITITKEIIETTVGTEVDLLKNATVSDNSKEELTISVVGDYDFNTVGEYSLKYTGEDSSGNKTEKEFTLKVNAKSVVSTVTTDELVGTTTKGYEIHKINGLYYINGILVANKTYTVPSTYNPGKLLSEFSVAFSKMQSDAEAEGITLKVVSGFRSYNTQNTLYNNYVARDGKEQADTYSARPGHSEHQTGLAADINTASRSAHFENTAEGIWLNENCYKYGFIIRYPKGKESITGYVFEPWHIRFIGDEAINLYNNGDWITLEEYLGIDSKY